MENLKNKVLPGIGGAVLGIVSYYLFDGWYNVIPWAIFVLALGYFGKNRNSSLVNGAIAGYFLFLAYIIVGYKRKTDTVGLSKFIIFAVLFSLVGSLLGWIGAFVGFAVKKKVGK